MSRGGSCDNVDHGDGVGSALRGSGTYIPSPSLKTHQASHLSPTLDTTHALLHSYHLIDLPFPLSPSPQDNHTEARKYYEQALAGTERTKGLTHFKTLNIVRCIGNLLQNVGLDEEAIEYYTRALAGRSYTHSPTLTYK